jgi:NAD(P)-dependent dehydrogenase (short-subunit alcohol dehydrogenase family)
MGTNSLTALITGGTSGIGRATAKKLAALGIHVLVVGRNAKRGDETLAEILKAGGKADFISSDLRNASSAREVAKRALELGDGHVDILINNAGIFPLMQGSFRSARRTKPRKKSLTECTRSTSRRRISSSQNLLR